MTNFSVRQLLESSNSPFEGFLVIPILKNNLFPQPKGKVFQPCQKPKNPHFELKYAQIFEFCLFAGLEVGFRVCTKIRELMSQVCE